MKIRSVLPFLAIALAGGPAYAQTTATEPTPPASTVKTQTATTGSTDLAKGGFVVSDKPKEDDPTYVNDVSVGAGGLFSAGNARQLALTSFIKARIRRDDHQFSGGLSLNYARAGAKVTDPATGRKTDGPVDTTIENFQGLLRYDYYLSNKVSLFLQSTGRRDRFQGLDLRLNVDPGVAYYFINDKTHRLQAELGYDLQHDIRRNEDRGVPPAPVLDKTKTLHNARGFLGYENKLRKEVALLASFEFLQSFEDAETFRFIADIGLKSNIADSLALATTYTARYENKPLPDIQQLDSIASVSLVYTLF